MASTGSAVNLFGSDFVLDGVSLADGLAIGDTMTIVDRDVTLSGLLVDGSAFSFDLNSTDANNQDLFDSDSALTVTLVSGVILTFDHNPIPNRQDLDQNYGDNVTGSPDLLGHEYDSISGFGLGSTPNVALTYGPNQPRLWTTGYGDLTNVYFNDLDGDTSLQIELAADAGFEVGLFGFDVASFINAGQTIEGLQVRDGSGNILYSTGSTFISGTGHNDFDFPAGLFADVLVIDIDLTGLGGESDEIAIDNVHFGQRAATAAVLLGDVNQDGAVTFADIPSFIEVLQAGTFLDQADANEDGVVDFGDIPAFIAILQGG